MKNLSELNWDKYDISGDKGLFKITSSSSSIDKNKLFITDFGKIPYLTRTDMNNGINQFIGELQKIKYKMDEGNVITIGLDTQTIFYQAHHFFTGQNIQVLKHKELNKFNALFTIPLLKIQMEKFNWGGNGATLGRLSRTKIMLPISKNKPDYEYMEQYSKSIIDKKLEKYKTYAKSTLNSIKYKEIEKLEDKEWKEFSIDEIMYVKAGVRLTKADMIKGNKPFIGSTDSNNGITAYVSNSNQSEDSNVLGVNYNGSVVENFYHPYSAIFSDDVKRLSLKHINGNKYLYLFIKNLILKQKSKYQYAYKFNEARLKRQKILLPINDLEQPDYEYMEQYIKNLMYKKIKQYLEYIEKQSS